MKRINTVLFGLLFVLAGNLAFAETNVTPFSPIENGQLKSIYSIKQSFQADPTVSCMDSVAINRADAFRCFAQNGIYDPCFQQNENTVICLRSPWDSQVTQIQTNQSLTSRTITENKDLMPWALELQNNAHCTLLMGATWVMSDMRANYSCTDKTYLYGDIDKSKKVWTIHQQRHKNKCLEHAAIKTVFE